MDFLLQRRRATPIQFWGLILFGTVVAGTGIALAVVVSVRLAVVPFGIGKMVPIATVAVMATFFIAVGLAMFRRAFAARTKPMKRG